MSLTNISKPSTSLTNLTKASFGETWDTIQSTWNSETRTWDESGSLFSNDSKPVVITTSGPNSPGTTANDGFGFSNWSSVNNSKVSDNTYSTVVFLTGGGISDRLKATNFGFSIPTGSTINGISVEVETKISANTATLSAYIVKGGTEGSERKYALINGVTTTEQYLNIPATGFTTELWGETWTVDDINASNFGVSIIASGSSSGTVSVDHIRMTIHYTTNQIITNQSRP